MTAEIVFTGGEQAAAMYEMYKQDQGLEIRLDLEGVDEPQVVSGLTRIHPLFFGDERQRIQIDDSIRSLNLRE